LSYITHIKVVLIEKSHYTDFNNVVMSGTDLFI